MGGAKSGSSRKELSIASRFEVAAIPRAPGTFAPGRLLLAEGSPLKTDSRHRSRKVMVFGREVITDVAGIGHFCANGTFWQIAQAGLTPQAARRQLLSRGVDLTTRPKGGSDMSLIRTASVALALGVAVAMSAPAGAATMHKPRDKVVKAMKPPHYKNPIIGFFLAILHLVDKDNKW